MARYNPASYKNDEQADDRYNPAMLREAEQKAAEQQRHNREFDDITKNYDKTADDSQENANIDKARSREQAGNGIKVDFDSIRKASKKFSTATGGKVSINFKKAGPTGAVVAAAMAGFGILTFTPAGIPLLSFTQNATDARANSSRVQAVRHESSLRYMIGNKQVEAACAKSVSSVRCKLGTMSEKTKAQYENSVNKFKIDGEQVGNRWIVKSITAPDGTVMKTGDSFINKTKTDVKFRLAASRAYNARSLVFNGGEYLKRVLVPKGLDKSLLPELPKDKDAQIKKLNTLFKLNEDGTVDEDKLRSNLKERTKDSFTAPDGNEEGRDPATGKIKLAKGLAAIPGTACVAYNTARLVVNTAKIERTLYLASLTMPFLKAGSQIRDNGSIHESTVSALSNQVTATASSGSEKGLSALDSQGLKLLFGSDETGLAEYSKNFMLYNNTILKDLDKMTGRIDQAAASVPGGGGTVRSMCRIVSSWQGQVIGVGACAALAAIQGGGGAAAGTVVPVLGNLVGGAAGIAAGAAECLAAVVGSLIVGKGISWFIDEYIIPWSMKAAVEGLPNATTVGPKLGEGLAVGAASLLNGGNRINGLLPERKESLSVFNESLHESDALYKETEVLAAKDTPFDIYNRYSFLGSIVSGMNNLVYTQDSRMASGNLAVQRLFGAFSLTPSVLAVGESPSVITAADMAECKDYGLRAMNASCDISDQVPYGMTAKAMMMDFEPNLKWMESHDEIDESGAPNTNNPGTKINGVEYTYAKAVEYCFERQTEIGATTEPIESDNYDWATGERCYDENEAMDNYQAYHSAVTGNNDGDQTEGQGRSGAGGEFRMATFNLLGANHGQQPKKRLDEALRIVRENDFDIVGLQEVEESQFKGIEKDWTEYDIYPKPSNSNVKEYSKTNGSRNAIIWKKDKFTLNTDKSGTKPFFYFNGDKEQYPYVSLSSGGQEIIMFNTHDPTSSPRAGNQSKWRVRDAEIHLKNITEANADGTPVFITGDFNSAFEIRRPEDNGLSRDELTYCILTSTGKIHNAYDVFHGKTGKCPTTTAKDSKGSKIDHIYMTSGIEVPYWEKIQKKDTDEATDHPVVFADIVIPGAGGDETVSSANFSYPFGEDDYKKNPAAYLRAHTAVGSDGPTGTAWGSDSMGTTNKGGGIAVDISAPAGKPVRAMFGGTVTSTNLCPTRGGVDLDDGIAIKSNIGGGTLGVAYMHGTKQRFKVGDTVKAGDVIMDVGTIGCNVFGAHLHVGMAWKASSEQNAKYICPQDVFVSGGKSLNFSALTAKGKASCGGRAL